MVLKFIPLFIFLAVFSSRLFTLTPYVWHNDAYNFLHVSWLWVGTGEYHPAHWPDFPGWVFLLASVFKFHTFFNTAPDAFSLMFDAQILTLAIGSLAAALFYLIAKNIFRSLTLTLPLTILFAFNPLFWRFSGTPMSDVPALAVMLLSFYFFTLFALKKNIYALAASGLVLGFASLFRLSSLVLLPAYALGLLAVSLSPSQPSYLERERVRSRCMLFFKQSAVLSVLSLIPPLIVFGPLFPYASSRPIFTSFGDLLFSLEMVFRLYVFRVVGWIGVFLGWLGFLYGFMGKRQDGFFLTALTRAFSFLFYFSSWYLYSLVEVERYLLPALPFTVLGIGFLLKHIFAQKNFFAYGAVIASIAIFCSMVLWGIAGAGEKNLVSEGPSVKKFMLLPASLASRIGMAEGRWEEIVPLDFALSSIVTSESLLLNSAFHWSSPHFFFSVSSIPDREIIPIRLDTFNRGEQYEDFPFDKYKKVFVHPFIEDAFILDDFLQNRGFLRKFVTQGVTVYLNYVIPADAGIQKL